MGRLIDGREISSHQRFKRTLRIAYALWSVEFRLKPCQKPGFVLTMSDRDGAWRVARLLSYPSEELWSQLRGTVVVAVEEHQNGVTVGIEHREPNRVAKRFLLHKL
jgi:hypothetical protein